MTAMHNVYISDAENKPEVFFNTRLDPRSFARTKMSQSLTEQGFVVNPDGSHEIWKAAGVDEKDGFMQFWGPLFNGKRLDSLIDEAVGSGSAAQNALNAIVLWIRSKMFLGETLSAANPAAAFISCEDGKPDLLKSGVFFSPEHLTSRCLFMEKPDKFPSDSDPVDPYNSPDLKDLDSSAFCAAAMLYELFSKTRPFLSGSAYQDMREGVFMPIHIAAPNLNEKLSGLIQSALMLPVSNNKSPVRASDVLSDILKILLNNNNEIVSYSSLFSALTEEKTLQIDNERKRYLFKLNKVVKTKRFILRNRTILLIGAAVLVSVVFIMFTMMDNISQRPTTAGMYPDNVIYAYLDAFSSLDHVFMEACLDGAGKNDLNAAISITAIVRTRLAYESSMQNLIPAQVWKENGGELPSPDVFGVTDLSISLVSGSLDEGIVTYRVAYLLWPINEDTPINRTDIMTLKPDRKKNWRITEIARTERQ